MCFDKECQMGGVDRRDFVVRGTASLIGLGALDPRASTQEKKQPPTRVLDDAAVRHGKVQLKRADKEIDGYLARPKAEGKHPAVLVVAGGLGSSVNFFHLDCLASAVRLNVDVDVALTVLANGCYRWLASRLPGFDKAGPKHLYRKFVETSGLIEVESERIVVHFDKRCHNPILREAALDRNCPGIPWLRNLPVAFAYP
jgi:hypothetical protein